MEARTPQFTKLIAMKSFPLLLFVILLSSCAKDETTIDDITGTYAGYAVSSAPDTIYGEMTISKTISGETNVLIQEYILDPGTVQYYGTLSSDSKTITVLAQTIFVNVFTQIPFMGEFHIHGATLTGHCIANYGMDITLDYTMQKK